MTESAAFRQAWGGSSRPLPIVVIGAGGIVRNAHLPAYKAMGFEVAGIFDRHPATAKKTAKDFGIRRVFASLGDALNEEDVVYDVAVPAGAVLGIVEALPSRSAVLIQKPLGRDLAEARLIVKACRRSRLRAAVNFQLRYAPNMLALADAVKKGRLGRVCDVDVRVHVHTPWELWGFLKGIPRHEILYHSIHYLDLLRSLLGEPKGAYCRGARRPQLKAYGDTATSIILDYGDWMRVSLVMNHTHVFGEGQAQSQIKVEGTRGAAVAKMGVNLDYPKGEKDGLWLSTGKSGWKKVGLRGSWFNAAFEGPMSNLQRFVAGQDRALWTGVEDAAKTMALVEACYRSSRGGGTPIPKP